MPNTVVDRDRLLETYDAWSSSYDDGSTMTATEAIAVRSILAQLQFQRVLDAGAGTGRWALELAAAGARVTALDNNANMLAQAQDKARRADLDIEFTMGDISATTWPAGSFDLVMCNMTLAHVPALSVPLSAFSNALTSGGHLLVSDLHPTLQAEAPADYHEMIAGDRRYFPQCHGSIDDYADAISAAGLAVEGSVDVPINLPPRGVIAGILVTLARKPPGRERPPRSI